VVYILSRHALLWDNGILTYLGSLGGNGTFGPGNIALELNNHGEVVGASDLKPSGMKTSDLEIDTNFHGFLWTRETGMQDLGTLPGVVTLPGDGTPPPPDADSVGLGINDRGEIVGTSFDASGNPRAFLRRKGEMVDLNKLVPVDSSLYLLFAHGINSSGEIVGFGVVPSTGDIHAFVATPCRLDHADTNWCKKNEEGATAEGAETSGRPRVVLSDAARKLIQRRLRFNLLVGQSNQSS